MPLDTNRTIEQKEYDQLWLKAQESKESSWHHQGFESWRLLPKSLGKGETRVFDLHSNLKISIEHNFYWQPIRLDYSYRNENSLLFNFYIKGDRRVINPGIAIEADREETANETCICYISEARSIEYFPAQQDLQNLTISVSLDYLQSFASQYQNNNDNSLLKKLFANKPLDSFHQCISHNNLIIRNIIQNLLNCPYDGVIKQMYIESKTLELLALQFSQLAENSTSSPPINFRRDDIERLYLARDILEKSFDSPPSLMGLAREIKLNDCKLKQGFRYLFGTTVFGYVHHCRMEEATKLLSQKDLSITYIAQKVGYASPSRFCHAFKRSQGMTPSTYRRQLISYYD